MIKEERGFSSVQQWILNRKVRGFFSVFLSAFVSLFLFYFMSALIRNEGSLEKSVSDQLVIEFIRFKKDTDFNERKRLLPKPPKKKPLPQVPLKMSQVKPEINMKTLDLPPLDFSIKGSGPGVGGYGGYRSGGAVPLVRMQPLYPRRAALQKVEGWVDLVYDITHIGTVKNIRVIKANPTGFFEKSTIQAMRRWKFKPKIEDGIAVAQSNVFVRMDFKLDRLEE